MKKVEALESFQYRGADIQPGFQIWVHDHEVDGLSSEGKIKVLLTPENRQKK